MRSWIFGCLAVFGPVVACGGHIQDETPRPAPSSSGASGGASPSSDASSSSDAAPPKNACTDAATDSGASLPLGVYTKCTDGAVESYLTAGGDAAGTLTLTETGGILSVTFGDDLFAIAPGTLSFTPLTTTSAVAVPGQSYGLQIVSCATSTVTAGALALDGSVLVLTLGGQGCGDAIGASVSCPLPAQPTATLEAGLCDEVDGEASSFPRATYGQCTGSISGYGDGTVTLSESQGVWTAALDGVTSIGETGAQDSLTFSPRGSGAATVTPGQTLSIEEDGWGSGCSGSPSGTDGVSLPVPVMRTMTVTNGSFVVDGSTLFVFVGGTDECGNAVSDSFNCTAQ